MSRKPLIAANWKMNKTSAKALEFVEKLNRNCKGETKRRDFFRGTELLF